MTVLSSIQRYLSMIMLIISGGGGILPLWHPAALLYCNDVVNSAGGALQGTFSSGFAGILLVLPPAVIYSIESK